MIECKDNKILHSTELQIVCLFLSNKEKASKLQSLNVLLTKHLQHS